jgi:GH18 family chitinase
MAALVQLADGEGARAVALLRELRDTLQRLEQENGALYDLTTGALALSMGQQSQRDGAMRLLRQLAPSPAGQVTPI